MSSASWRRLLLTGCALAAMVFVFDALTFTVWPWHGDIGWSLRGTPQAFVLRVASVIPGGSAAHAGVRPGDTIDLRDYPPALRSRIAVAALPGVPLPLRVHRSAGTVGVTPTPSRFALGWDRWADFVGALWMLAIAAIIAWRRPDLGEARTLTVLLLSIALSNAFYFGNFNTPWVSVNVISWVCFAVPNAMALAVLAYFAQLFGKPISPQRRLLQALTYGAVAIQIALSLAIVTALTSGRIDPVPLMFSWWSPYFNHGIGAADLTPQLLALLCVLFAIVASGGVERQRATWATLAVSLLYGSTVIVNVISDLVPNIEYVHDIVLQPIFNIAFFAMPVGLMYSVLNRRILDIGFAVNRATVFAGVSIVVVGAFVFVEWALGHWLDSAGRLTGTAINLSLALVLGFSLRFIHGRVEAFVDRIFFSKRHENERALNRFAREAAFVTDAKILLDRTMSEVLEHAESAGVGILISDEAGAYCCARGECGSGVVGENDPAMLAMRAWHEPLDLHGYKTAIRSDFAFPMMARGKLIGVLACRAKRSGEAYAPDEYDALTALAQGVGPALDALSSGKAEADSGLLMEVRALSAKVDQILINVAAPRAPT